MDEPRQMSEGRLPIRERNNDPQRQPAYGIKTDHDRRSNLADLGSDGRAKLDHPDFTSLRQLCFRHTYLPHQRPQNRLAVDRCGRFPPLTQPPLQEWHRAGGRAVSAIPPPSSFSREGTSCPSSLQNSLCSLPCIVSRHSLANLTHHPQTDPPIRRSEERRVGKECRSRWLSYH